jgi:hypothetical protein
MINRNYCQIFSTALLMVIIVSTASIILNGCATDEPDDRIVNESNPITLISGEEITPSTKLGEVDAAVVCDGALDEEGNISNQLTPEKEDDCDVIEGTYFVPYLDDNDQPTGEGDVVYRSPIHTTYISTGYRPPFPSTVIEGRRIVSMQPTMVEMNTGEPILQGGRAIISDTPIVSSAKSSYKPRSSTTTFKTPITGTMITGKPSTSTLSAARSITPVARSTKGVVSTRSSMSRPASIGRSSSRGFVGG